MGYTGRWTIYSEVGDVDNGALRGEGGWYTAADMARRLRITPNGVWERGIRGQLERKRSGRNWLYREAEVTVADLDYGGELVAFSREGRAYVEVDAEKYAALVADLDTLRAAVLAYQSGCPDCEARVAELHEIARGK